MTKNKEKELDNNCNTVLSILKTSLFEADLVLYDGVDYTAVYQELVDQAILPITAKVYKSLPLDIDLFEKWHHTILQQIASGTQIQNTESFLIRLLDDNGIQSAILKGSAAAKNYPIGIHRVYGDVDIIVNPDDFEKAAGLLSNAGCKQATELFENYRNVTYYRNGVEIELHRHFFDEEQFKWDREIIYPALTRCQKVKIGSFFVNLLPDLENGLVLLQHFRQHIVGELGFRQLVDWLMFVNSVCDDAFWKEHFQLKAREMGLEQLAKVSTALGQQYFGLSKSITWCTGVTPEAVDELFYYLVDNGNFGKKRETKDRTIERIIGRNRSLFGWLKYLQSTGVSHWSLAQKNRFLRAFAWFYQLMRYVILGIKSGNVKDVINRNEIEWVKRKKKLYSLLGIE